MVDRQLVMSPESLELPFDDVLWEDPDYLTKQLITYIGNKRALLGPIQDAVELVCARLGQDRIRILDAFSGSGVVSRMLKRYASQLVVNDLEDYARIVSLCYLTNRADFPYDRVNATIERLNDEVANRGFARKGFIEKLYAPLDEERITSEDRVFYTIKNAKRLDAYRQLIEHEPLELRPWLLGPLLSAASIHANTAGVFKGFYKDRATGVGRFGGSGQDALSRIRATIRLQAPILSNYESHITVCQVDANQIGAQHGDFDLAYFDPPYNQHPYGSNYFMLNLLVNYREPEDVSKVSGIPTDWRRSRYNSRHESLRALTDLITSIDARFVLLSYNDEGFIPIDQMRDLLDATGTVEEIQIPYTTFRGSRNLSGRSPHVTEHLFLVDKR